METGKRIKNIIEALLIVSESGLSREEIKQVIGEVEPQDIDVAIQMLKDEYSSDERAFTLNEVAGKCRIVTKPAYMPWINNLYQPEPERLTMPALETLSIIAYKQPLTRAEVESIRGVNVGGVIDTLLSKELIAVKGRKDVIGKPLIYGTTEKFLELFGLNSLDDLPQLREFTEQDLDYGKTDENDIVANPEATAEGAETADENAAKDSENNNEIAENSGSIDGDYVGSEETFPETSDSSDRLNESFDDVGEGEMVNDDKEKTE
ncbi:MAG TPA: SMC-Scp complex subunit ScpB [Candidatus Omnitrophota bacterium]|nr:SMC-Scp complex subunit ScpB [Candidatus Omnitrophota bacterium]HPS19874.1 SMC-Scp complex subunit ScpB [Candidatus Omnitrophota bacterium]